MDARGVVQALYRWPVKSFGGERLEEAQFEVHGMAGDRAYALVNAAGVRADKVLTARQAPRMLGWSAAYHGRLRGRLVVTSPDGRRWGWHDPGLAETLRNDLGRPVLLVEDHEGGLADLPRTALVTVEASRQALEREVSRPLDLRRFRTNLHLDLDVEAFAEESWEGRWVRIGDEVVLRLLQPCPRCVLPTLDPGGGSRWPELLEHILDAHEGLFGVNAQVEVPGRVAVGDPVILGGEGFGLGERGDGGRRAPL